MAKAVFFAASGKLPVVIDGEEIDAEFALVLAEGVPFGDVLEAFKRLSQMSLPPTLVNHPDFSKKSLPRTIKPPKQSCVPRVVSPAMRDRR